MVADWSCGNMHVKSRELENNGVYKEALPAKMLNLVLSLFDLFHSFKFCLCPAGKKKKKSSSVVLGRCLANTQVHMQWKEVDWDKYLLQQTPTSWTAMIRRGKSKVKVIVEGDNRFQMCHRFRERIWRLPFCHIEEIKIHVPQ